MGFDKAKITSIGAVLVLLTISLRTMAEVDTEPLAANCPMGMELVVASAAGSFGDQVAREIERAISTSKRKKPSTIVVNKSGAAGANAFSHMQLSKNPCSVLVSINSLVTLNPLLLQTPNDPMESLALSVELMGSNSQILMVSSQSRFKSPQDLIAAIANREDLAYASSGVGSIASHVPPELIARDLGGSLTHVPTRGGIEPLRLVQQGQVDFTVSLPSIAAPLLQAGSIRMLAHTGKGELTVGADKVPSLSDAARALGRPLLTLESNPLSPWVAAWTKKDTPEEIKLQIKKALLAIRSSPEISKLAAMNSQIIPAGTTQNRNLQAERQFAAKIIQILNLRGQQ